MKRCNRHFYTSNQPYSHFQFEKSLRKYEVCPQKKIKLRSQLSTHVTNNPPLQTINTNVSLEQGTKRGESPKQEAQQDQIRKYYEDQDGIVQANSKVNFNSKQFKMQEQELAQNQQKQISCDKLNEIDRPESKRQIIAGEQAKSEVQKLDQKNELQKQQLDPFCYDKKKIHFQILQHNQPELNEDNAYLILSSEFNRAKNKEDTGPQGGRLTLAGNVSISLRRLSKHKQKGFTQTEMLEELIKQRSYLQAQRTEIAHRLQDFLQHN